MPTRFHYTPTASTAYGLTPAEILMATDEELNQLLSVKHIAPYRKGGLGMQGKGYGKRIREFKDGLKGRKWGEDVWVPAGHPGHPHAHGGQVHGQGQGDGRRRDQGWGQKGGAIAGAGAGGAGEKKKRMGKNERKRKAAAEDEAGNGNGDGAGKQGNAPSVPSHGANGASTPATGQAEGNGEESGEAKKKRRKKRKSAAVDE